LPILIKTTGFPDFVNHLIF